MQTLLDPTPRENPQWEVLEWPIREGVVPKLWESWP